MKLLTTGALREAIGTRGRQVRGVVFPSERGQPTHLDGHHSALSGLWHPAVGGPDRGVGDNAAAEYFLGTLKKELVNRADYQSRHQARLSIRYWIEAWQNPSRLHSTIGHRPPNEGEDNKFHHTAA